MNRLERAVYVSSLCLSARRLFSPNGAAPQSPGLVRLRTCPGCVNVTLLNPNGAAAKNSLHPAPACQVATPSGLTNYLIRLPRVARSSQPWALGRSPFGAGKAGLSKRIRREPRRPSKM
jgi:hypothetical protein